MNSYTLQDVERLIGLSRGVVQGFIDAGFVAPARGPRNELFFSFQDLIVLRTAQGLTAVKIPTRKVKQSLARLRAELPQTLPLSGVHISALGTRIVVRQGASQWQADSGQYLLDFDVASSHGEVAFLKTSATASERAEHWFDRGRELEASEPNAAERAYREAIARDPQFLAAYVNLGCLLQARGLADDAERIYRDAIAQMPDEPLLFFNIGIALEDLGRPAEAIGAYERVIDLDPEFADAHYNLSKMYEVRGHEQEAFRHLSNYRRLQGN